MVERNHTYAAYKRRFDEAYDWIEAELEGMKSGCAT